MPCSRRNRKPGLTTSPPRSYPTLTPIIARASICPSMSSAPPPRAPADGRCAGAGLCPGTLCPRRFARSALVLFCLVAARQQVVRFLPQMASLYASIGLPVNLRGLAFENIKTLREMHDGVPMLVVEGEIVGTTARHTEVPRLRFAVVDGSGKEIYAWSARPDRATCCRRAKPCRFVRGSHRHPPTRMEYRSVSSTGAMHKPDSCEVSWREYCLQKTRTRCANWSRAR